MTKTCFNHNENVAEISNELTNGTSYAKAIFVCLPSSHPFVEKEVYLNGKIKIGRTVVTAKQKDKLFFDSKVLSKNHAIIWYDNGKFFLRDTKSSNGTFVNGNRLSVALEESDDYQIFTDDVVQFGVVVTEAKSDEDAPKVHSGVYSLLKLYHPDGKPAIRPVTNGQVEVQCPNISINQLNILHDCLKLSMNREAILKEKLAFLKLQLTNLEEITKKKWDFVIDEDLLLSKIETLQNRLESILNTNNQLKNLSDQDHKFAVLTKEIHGLQEQKELYQFEFKSIVKKTFDDKRIAEAKLQETEVKLNSSLKEIKHLEALVNKCKGELSTADSQILFLDDELKTYKLETNKLADEKQMLEKQLLESRNNEYALNEVIKDLKLEIESKQLELKSIGVFKDVLNCSMSLNSTSNDLEHIQPNNNTQHNQQQQSPPFTNSKQLNGRLENDDQHFANCTDFFKCPINGQSSQKFLELLYDYLDETMDFNSTKLNRNEELLKHALAILVLENKNLIKQLEVKKENDDHYAKQPNSINYINSKFTSSLENNDAIIKKVQLVINNQKALINKENEINSLNKLVNELDESFKDLKSKYNELEVKVLRRGRIEEEAVRNDVRNVLDSVIEKVETKITQQEFDNTVNKLNEVQNDYDTLNLENKKLRKQNQVVDSEMKRLKDELEMVSYQNKMTHLLALIPITVLLVSIILAYLPFLSLATGTKDV